MQSRVKTRGKWETIDHTPKKSTGEKVKSVADKPKTDKTEEKTKDTKVEQK